MTDLLSKFDPIIEERETLLATGVKDPFLPGDGRSEITHCRDLQWQGNDLARHL